MAIIRTYEVKDRNKVIELLQLNIPTYFDPSELEDFKNYLDKELEQYFVLEFHDQLIACGGINFVKEERKAVISWDVVHPEFQGKGFGKKLLEHRIKILQNHPEVDKITVRTSQYTYLFYQKCGFQLLEIVKDYWAKGYDLYCMKYIIGPKN